MRATRIYKQSLRAYLDGFRYIINRGGTRSSKTYSVLMLFEAIARKSKRQMLITVVSHSLPHLEGGAIRDFDKILTGAGYNLDEIKTKRPYVYNINNTTIEFIGFDKPGKALGGARDILFINEANHMPFNIVHQLIQRTSETVFIDYNPSEEFWVDTEGYLTDDQTKVIDSTWKDNYRNLSKAIISDLLKAKKKHDEEIARGIEGYWYNYWRVYGLGLQGRLEGAVFNNWKKVDYHPETTVETVYGIDFGFASDKATLVRVSYYDYKLWVEELIYQSGLTNQALARRCKNFVSPDDLILADSAEPKSIMEMRMFDLKVVGATKGQDSLRHGINLLQEVEIMVKGENLCKELESYIWEKKINGEHTGKPRKGNDHLIDAMRYAGTYLIKRQLHEVA